MRFPLSLSRSMAGYLARKKWSGEKRFPIVLMLEPLHACNLRCSGCGRIREYSETVGQTMSVAECLAASDECGAPIVSVCGGEPLLYRELPELLDALIQRGKHLYLCSNGLELEKRLPEIAAIPNRKLKSRLYFNIHLDGPPSVHDTIVNRPGTFETALSGIQAAKKAGFRVYTNSTVYRPTTVDSLIEMADRLTEARIDGLMISPGFGYRAVLAEHQAKNGNRLPTVSSSGEETAKDDFFMDRTAIHVFFQEVRRRMGKYRLTATPVFFDFLCGRRELTCAAWANPTRNVRGWRSPCYLLADEHYSTYRELLEKTDWSKIGSENDPRCRDCLTHCGFEPASVLAARGLGETLRLLLWQFQK